MRSLFGSYGLYSVGFGVIFCIFDGPRGSLLILDLKLMSLLSTVKGAIYSRVFGAEVDGYSL